MCGNDPITKRQRHDNGLRGGPCYGVGGIMELGGYLKKKKANTEKT